MRFFALAIYCVGKQNQIARHDMRLVRKARWFLAPLDSRTTQQACAALHAMTIYQFEFFSLSLLILRGAYHFY